MSKPVLAGRLTDTCIGGLPEAMTPSLEALEALSAAMKEFVWPRRLPLLQRAVALDPEFAMAHAQVGFGLSNMGESELAQQSLLKAHQLRDRASDVERFYIDTLYDRDVTGNLPQVSFHRIRLSLPKMRQEGQQPACQTHRGDRQVTVSRTDARG